MARQKYSEEKQVVRQKSTADFKTLMKSNFTVAQFLKMISTQGLPVQDARDICDSFRELKK